MIAPELIRDLDLDTEGLGVLSAAFFYVFALTQIPITIFLDRIGPRRLMTGLSLIGVIGAVVFSVAENLTAGMLGRVLLGIGMACNLMGTLKLLSEWFRPSVFATLTGVIFSIGTAGNMLSTTPLVALVAAAGWRGGFQIIAAVNLALTLVFWFIVRDRPGRMEENGIGARAATGMRQAFASSQINVTDHATRASWWRGYPVIGGLPYRVHGRGGSRSRQARIFQPRVPQPPSSRNASTSRNGIDSNTPNCG